MNHRWLLRALASTVLVSPLAAQGGGSQAATMAPGKYTIETRDTMDKKNAIVPMPFELKGNGNWVITQPDGTFNGKMKMKDGVLTYSDQGCLDAKDAQREGTYTLRTERGGYWLEVKTDPCEERGKLLAGWLFRPVKK